MADESNVKTVNTHKVKTVISAALALLAVVYIIYHIVLAFKPTTPLFTVTYASFDDSSIFSGYIFRDDIKLVSPVQGAVYRHYSDSEKIPSEATVATVYPFGTEDAVNKISEIDREIDILKKSALVSLPVADELDTRIVALRAEISDMLISGDTVHADTLSDELAILLNKRALLSTGKTDYSEQITILTAERASLLISLGSGSTVTSSRSGYFYSYSDGYEGVLTKSAAKSMTADDFISAVNTGKTVSQYNVVGSLVTDSEWYYLCLTDTENANRFSAGVYYNAVFTDNACRSTIPLMLESKSAGADGSVLLKFRSEMIPLSFDMTRMQRASIVSATYTGLRIPVSSVRYINGTTFVYVFKKGLSSLREVNVIFEQDGYYLVSGGNNPDYTPIALNDLIILDNEDMYEGKIID